MANSNGLIKERAVELSQPFVLDGREVTVCPSIGVALSNPCYADASDMMRDGAGGCIRLSGATTISK